MILMGSFPLKLFYDSTIMLEIKLKGMLLREIPSEMKVVGSCFEKLKWGNTVLKIYISKLCCNKLLEPQDGPRKKTEKDRTKVGKLNF